MTIKIGLIRHLGRLCDIMLRAEATYFVVDDAGAETGPYPSHAEARRFVLEIRP